MQLANRFNPASRKRGRNLIAAALLTCACAGPAQAEDLEQMAQFVGLMQNFFVLMDSMYTAASNPEHAALLQMNSLEDMYKETGNLRQMVDVYRDVIKRSSNPTVTRLARMRLADALKESGQMDEAIEVLKQAINETVEHANRQ